MKLLKRLFREEETAERTVDETAEHIISCKELQYRVTDVGYDVNKACVSIETVAQFKTLIKNANDDQSYKSIKHTQKICFPATINSVKE